MAVAGCATVPEAAEAHSRAQAALAVINQMNSQPRTAAALRNAQAVLIVLDYAKAGFILGAQGGDGVLLTRHDGHWGDPAFCTLGGVSIGLQAGIETGPVAYLLMSPRAVQEFDPRKGKTHLGADAGLTVVRFSSATNMVSTLASADVIVWTGTAGLFGGVAFDSAHVVADPQLDEAYSRGPAPGAPDSR
ncbi:MAG: lipid-binding SYLF domain-containing protein [Steroidobacteraceae bacterium]